MLKPVIELYMERKVDFNTEVILSVAGPVSGHSIEQWNIKEKPEPSLDHIKSIAEDDVVAFYNGVDDLEAKRKEVYDKAVAQKEAVANEQRRIHG